MSCEQELALAIAHYQAAVSEAQAAYRQRIFEGRAVHDRHFQGGRAPAADVLAAQERIDAAKAHVDHVQQVQNDAMIALQAARAARCAELEPAVKAAVARRDGMRKIIADCERIIASLRGPTAEASDE